MPPETFPVLAAFLVIQTTITIPLAGVMWRQNIALGQEKDKRIADRDKTIADQQKEIAFLNGRCDDYIEKAFDAVQGMSSATGMARETVQIVKQERAARGTR